MGIETTNMTAVNEAKGVKIWYPNIRAVLLHPYIRGHFAADFFINRARMTLLSKLMRHGTPEDQPSGEALGAHLDYNANIEAALHP